MLSVVVTAWNEEKNLSRAVASVRQLADEIIVVVDEASTDNTLAVAKGLQCQVFTHVHAGIVEPMRNWSISKASGDWILLLDADEEITAELASRIQKLVRSTKSDYFRIGRKNMIFNRWIKSEHWWPDYVYRLFKKGHVSWEDVIHSVPFTRGKGEDLPIKEDLAILHHHYETVGQYVDRLNRYTDHQVQHLVDQGYSFTWSDVVTKPVEEFLTQYFARRGYSEGLHGLALALLQAFSECVLYLKMWQYSGFVPVQVIPDQVQEVNRKQQQQLRWWLYQAKVETSPWPVKWGWKLLRKIGL